jgi:hypothetical protein
VPGVRTEGSWSWAYDGDDRPHATIGYEADLTDESNAWLRLRYHANDQPADYRVRLVTTTPNYGGRSGGLLARSCEVTAEPPAAWRSFIFLPVKSISGAARATNGPTRHARRAENIGASWPRSVRSLGEAETAALSDTGAHRSLFLPAKVVPPNLA